MARPSSRPAYVTLFFNGVLVHNRGADGTNSAPRTRAYTPQQAEGPLVLQDHQQPVRYRNIWVRRLRGYDDVTR